MISDALKAKAAYITYYDTKGEPASVGWRAPPWVEQIPWREFVAQCAKQAIKAVQDIKPEEIVAPEFLNILLYCVTYTDEAGYAQQ